MAYTNLWGLYNRLIAYLKEKESAGMVWTPAPTMFTRSDVGGGTAALVFRTHQATFIRIVSPELHKILHQHLLPQVATWGFGKESSPGGGFLEISPCDILRLRVEDVLVVRMTLPFCGLNS